MLRWHAPQSVVPLDSQQGGELTQAMQPLGRDVGRLVVSSQHVSPDVLLLQAVEEVLDLEDNAQTPPLRLKIRHLLLLHRLLLGSQQLQRQDDSFQNKPIKSA